jgi:hypothetical protein
MSTLIAHRIISTTTAVQAADSISDWYSAEPVYNDKGIFKNINKNYFAGFLSGLKTVNNEYAYVTSDSCDYKNIVYTVTATYNSSVIGWKAAYPYYTYK